MYRTRCSLCGHRIKYPEEQAGRNARCPHCSFPLRLPLHGNPQADEGPESATGRDLANLTALNRQLNRSGVERLSHFLDHAPAAGVARFSSWLRGANENQIYRAADTLNIAGPTDIDPLQDWWLPGPAGPARVVSCAGCHGPADPTDEYHFHGYQERRKFGDQYRYVALHHGAEHYCKRCITAARQRIVRLAVVMYLALWMALGSLAVYGLVQGKPAYAITALVAVLLSLMGIPFIRQRTREEHVGGTLALSHNRQRLAKKGLWVLRPGRGPAA